MSDRKSSQKFPRKALIAVAWPYANGDLHLGHLAGALLPATIMNDFLRLLGTDVIMVSGSDMHGTPVAVKAWKEKRDPLDYAKEQHARHVDVLEKLGMVYSLYTTTSTQVHAEVVQGVFRTLADKGLITKQVTEQFWSEKERKYLLDRYIEGECPHCHFAKARGDQCDNCGRTLTPEQLIKPYSIFGDKELVYKSSTNYYLNLDKLQPLLEDLFAKHPNYKNWRKHVQSTTQSWIKEGLEPRAISRDMEGYGVQLPVGYEIEGEDGKVIYVWFEAVTGYLSAPVELALRAEKLDDESEGVKYLEKMFGIDSSKLKLDADLKIQSNVYDGQSLAWQDYWVSDDSQSYYFIGKDNIPFHTIIWPAMLLGLNENSELKLNLPWNVPANQYLNLSGGKFSKSTGNFIRALDFMQNYGSDTARFYLSSRMPEQKDYDFTWSEFVDAVNNELVANPANFVHRTLSFWNKQFAADGITSGQNLSPEVKVAIEEAFTGVQSSLLNSRFAEGWQQVAKLSSFANKYFNDSQIWQVVKTDKDKAATQMYNLIQLVGNLGLLVRPFLPEFSDHVLDYLAISKPNPEVGKNHWSLQIVDTQSLREIGNLKPLINKLDLDQVLASEGVEVESSSESSSDASK